VKPFSQEKEECGEAGLACYKKEELSRDMIYYKVFTQKEMFFEDLI